MGRVRITTSRQPKESPLNDRRFLSLFLIVFIDLVGFGIVIPILLLHAKENLGASDLQATLLLSAYSIALLIGAPILGRLSDAFGRRPVLIVSQIGTMLGFLLLGFSKVLILLYIGRIIDGISGGNIVTARAYINDITTEENRARGFGVISAAFGAGFIVGPALGGLVPGISANVPLLAPISQQTPFLLAAIFSLLSTLGTIFLLPETLPPDARRPLGQRERPNKDDLSTIELLRPSGVRLVLSFSMMIFLAFSMLQASFPILVRRNIFSPDLPLEQVQRNIGFYFLAFGIVQVLMQAFAVGPAVKRFGEQKLIVFATVLRIGCFLTIALTSSSITLGIVFTVIAIGSALSQPSVQSILSRFATPSTRGQLMGIMQAVQSLGLVIGPIIAGLLLESQWRSISPRTVNALPMFASAAFVSVALLIGLFMLRVYLPSEEKIPAQPTAAPAH